MRLSPHIIPQSPAAGAITTQAEMGNCLNNGGTASISKWDTTHFERDASENQPLTSKKRTINEPRR